MLTGRRQGLRFLIYAAAAGGVLFLFTLRAGWSGMLSDSGLAPFSRMIQGEAERPFVQRLLLPTATRWLHMLLPAPARDAIANATAGNIRFAVRLGWTTQHSSEVALALLLAFGCYVALAFALRRLVLNFYVVPEWIGDLAPAAALIALPVFFLPNSVQLYDPSTLLLSALGLRMIAGRRRVGFYVVFALACLNRETAILLTALFLLHERGRVGRLRLATHGLVQGVVWAALLAGTDALYAHNPGHGLQLLFPRNLLLLVQPRAALGFWPLALVTAALVAHRWPGKPLFLRRGLAVTGLTLLAGAALFTLPTETRQYLDLYPLLCLLVLPSVLSLLEIPVDVTSAAVAHSPSRL